MSSRMPARLGVHVRSAVRTGWLALLVCGAMAHGESLYREGTFRSPIADNKAARVGDVLTVQVYENSSATTSADTGTRRSNSLSAELSHRGVPVTQTSLGIGGDFEGGGRTQRANRVLATVTVTVREVLPSGELRVAGEQLLTVNQEPQKVSLEGRVRPLDISDGNVVMSTRLADAKIAFVGDGDLTERSRRPWWRTFLDGIGL